MKNPKVISLFSGCGGLDLGFKLSGYNIIWANDIIEDACKTYKLNIGEHIFCGDIKEFPLKNIPKADVIIGGPPCQSFSLVGKRDPNDERSNLVWSYLKILEQIKPKIFVMENVTGILSAKNQSGKKVIDDLIFAFNNIGYAISVIKLNAADYGVPQKRVRVFIIGCKNNIIIDEPPKTHSEDNKYLKKWITTFEALSDLSDTTETGIGKYLKKPCCGFQEIMRKGNGNIFNLHFIPYASKKDQELIEHIPPGGNYADVPDEIATTRILNFKKTGGRTTTYGRLDKNKPAFTLNTHFNRLNVGCNIHYEKNRLISIREALRIQSFPDVFKIISSNKRNYYVQVGNAVPPLLAKSLAAHIYNYI